MKNKFITYKYSKLKRKIMDKKEYKITNKSDFSIQNKIIFILTFLYGYFISYYFIV